jgi:hypothetical protein
MRAAGRLGGAVKDLRRRPFQGRGSAGGGRREPEARQLVRQKKIASASRLIHDTPDFST